MKRCGAFLTAAAALLSACAHPGGPYRRPESALANAPDAQAAFVSAAKGPFVDKPLPDKWWRLYEDPLLDSLIAEAFAANTDLRVAAANISRAQALVAEAEAQAGVQTGTSAGMVFARPTGTGGDAQIRYNAGVSISYEIDLGGRLRSLLAAHG